MYTHIMSDCRVSLNEDTLRRAVETILSARSIFFIGIGSSSTIAHYAYSRFLHFGIPCSYESDPVFFRVRSSILQKGDVLFAISSSGRTKPVVAAAQSARQSGTPVISICDFSSAPLTEASDMPLYTTFRESRRYVNEDFPLVVGQLLIVDIIHACCIASAGRSLDKLMEISRKYAQSEKLQP